MTQGRMHPDDLRAIMAAQLALSSDDLTTGDVARGIEGADAILAELARTAKPEATSEWPKEALDRIEAWASSCEFHIDRAEKAEARVKELEEAIKKHRSIVKGSHHWRGCDWDKDLLAKVNP